MAGVNAAYQAIVRGDRRVRVDPPPSPSDEPTPPPAAGADRRVYASEIRDRARRRARVVGFSLFGAFALVSLVVAFGYLTADYTVSMTVTDAVPVA